jgi:glycosyltransferase involved in cell wall biosynthesis
MVLLDTHPDYMSFDGSSQTATEYPVALYREFLAYVRTKYAGEYWHAVPKEVAAHVAQIRSSGTSVRKYDEFASPEIRRLRGKRVAALLFSHYPADPRPRRAAEALAAHGANVDLICLRDGDGELARETYGSINVTRVRLKRHRGGKLSYIGQYAAFVLTSFFYLAWRSLTRRYDLVHVHNMPDVLVFSAIVPKLLGAKVILDLHDPMPELMQTIFKLPEDSFSVRVLKRLEKWSTRFADLVLTVNLACKRIYSSRSCQPDKIRVVINSPDDEVFRFQSGDVCRRHAKNGNGSKPFVILYHGSLVHRNGFDLALESLEKVRKNIPSARLMVCGKRTNFFEKVMEMAQERGLDTNIDYLGVRNLKEIVEAIEDCDLGIIPNHRNIFTEINTPTRIFECLALAKPVIAPKTKGIQDYFGDNDLIFFELGNSDDLARKIEFAFSHPAEVAETVKRGQEIYLSHTWSRERLSLLNSISELL